jgi:hypothetical protein
LTGLQTPLERKLTQSLIDITIESWRFARLFARLIHKVDAGEQTRFFSQFRYYLKRLEESLALTDFKLVDIEGQLFDPGMAATALNIADFCPDDLLVVDQMLEPIIMGPWLVDSFFK